MTDIKNDVEVRTFSFFRKKGLCPNNPSLDIFGYKIDVIFIVSLLSS